MRVILTREVPKIGKAGQTLEVKDGYARNFLIPQGLAVPATAGNQSAADMKARQRLRQAETLRAQARALAEKLNGQVVTVKAALGAQGKLHGAVTAKDVAAAAADAFAVRLEKHALVDFAPIGELGNHPVQVKLHPEVTARLMVKVVDADG